MSDFSDAEAFWFTSPEGTRQRWYASVQVDTSTGKIDYMEIARGPCAEGYQWTFSECQAHPLGRAALHALGLQTQPALPGTEIWPQDVLVEEDEAYIELFENEIEDTLMNTTARRQ